MSLIGLFTAVRSNIRNTYGVWITYRQLSNQTAPETQQTNDTYEEDIRDKILEASLPYVKDKGWSKDAISAGARDVGYPTITHGMFVRGGADLVHYFQTSSNKKLNALLKKESEIVKPIIPGEFVEKAVKVRLEMTIPYLSRWPQALALMTLPPNVPNALATLLTMVDDICYYAGDRSVDFNWYARRIALAGVYKATELYLIQDNSPEYVDTWKFLNRRLGEAIKIQDILNQTDLMPFGARDGITSAFTTARNILGLNWNR